MTTNLNEDHGQEKKVKVISNGFENHDDNSLAIRVDDKGQDSGVGGHGNGSTEVEEHLVNVTGDVARLEPPRARSKRVAALDAFRGLTIVVMILVDDAGEANDEIEHSPWNGCTLADFVMPFFLFIVGVAIAFALKRVPRILDAMRKITIRTLKLLVWGILLQDYYILLSFSI